MTNRYPSKVTLYAQTPSGQIVNRKTDHMYKFVALVFTEPGQSKFYAPGWNVVSWHETETAAKKKAALIAPYFKVEIVPVTETPTFKPVSVFSENGRGWIVTHQDGAKVRIDKLTPDFKVTQTRVLLPDVATKYVWGLIMNAGYKMHSDGAFTVSPFSTYGAE